MKGYCFTVDDDLIYPEDYIETMINGIEKHNNPVAMHGRCLSDYPVKSYFFDDCRRVRHDIKLKEDLQIHIWQDRFS